MNDGSLGRADRTGLAQSWAIYCLVGGVVCFAWLGSTDVVSMEGILADGARYMARTGDYWVPHLYGEVYAYKPPLCYWLAWASFWLFGRDTEWTLRLPIALTGFLMGTVVLAIFARRLSPRTACLCALASLTGVIVIQKVQMAEFDMPLGAGVGIAVAAACANLSDRRTSWALWMIGYAGLAMGFLAKGMPAVMVYAPGLLVAAVATRRWRELISPAHLIGVTCCIVPVAAWLACAWHAHGMQVFEQPFTEARDRGFDWGWKALGLTLTKPIVIVGLFLPWSIVLPVVFSKSWRCSLDEASRRLVNAATSFLLAGTLAFLLVPTNNPRYFVPLCVPMGILAGVAATADLARFDRLRRGRRLASFLCLATVAVVSAIVACGLVSPAGMQPLPRGLLAMSACIEAAVWIHAFRRRDERWPAKMLILCALGIWAIDAWAARPYRAASRSLRETACALDAELPEAASVWTAAGDSHSSLFFYLRRPVRSFEIGTGNVPAGAFVVVTSEQFSTVAARRDVDFSVVAKAGSNGRAFVLAQAR